MSAPNDGGPAFPVHETPESTDTPGMSLRDYFAARIMATLMRGAVLPPGFDATEELEFAARRAYECADAMLKVRAA